MPAKANYLLGGILKMQKRLLSVCFSMLFTVIACGNMTDLSSTEVIGPNPELPLPNPTLIPTVQIASAVGWPDGAKPVVAKGLQIIAFAENLQHPRWLYELPNGDILVAETNQPAKANSQWSLRNWIAGIFMKRAGAGVATANQISLLRDTNHDGVADQKSVLIKDLNSPFGMALVGDDLYVANTDALLKFKYQLGQTVITQQAKKMMDLPAGEINSHWTKNIIVSPDQSKLYITVGSNSNIAEKGMHNEVGRAAIWQLDLASGQYRIFASGLRNPNGMAWEPNSDKLWVVVNERDELGNNLVPDYLTSVADGGFYGWPYSYFGQHIDQRVQPQNDQLVASAIAPDYALGAHTASLGLAYSATNELGEDFQHGMFIGQHGSWNRKPFSGYKVIFVPFQNGMPVGMPREVVTGFLNSQGQAQGRPVGVLVNQRGCLLVADDVGNKIWHIKKSAD